MESIQSAGNPVVKRLRALKDAKARQEARQFLVEGEVMIREALSCGLSPADALMETPDDSLFETLTRAGARVRLASRAAVEAACDTKTPQGVCAAFALPEARALEAAHRKIVALDGVQDPGNLGTIWRTADAAGFHALLLGEGCADPYSPKVQRAAMGSGFRLPAIASSLPSALALLREKGYSVIVSALDGEDIYARAPLPNPEKFALVVGNEARGVSPEVQRLAGARVKIPMRGGAESLNAAVAAGILMYEFTRPKETDR